ncbi:MAG: hypothetical protein ACT4P6_08925 [Gemmatimonadaceae bacterium]
MPNGQPSRDRSGAGTRLSPSRRSALAKGARERTRRDRGDLPNADLQAAGSRSPGSTIIQTITVT